MKKLEDIIKVMNEKGYNLFLDSQKPYNLNIVGIRTVDDSSNTFNDELHVFWVYNGWTTHKSFAITTDPGLFWRENPMNAAGTAILKEGQHKGLWQIGKHRGRYKALTQKGLATVYRDNNEDEILDMVPGSEEDGYFGINCHKAGVDSSQVDKWSAGCQVFKSEIEYDNFISTCDQARLNWGNSFSYTLLLDSWFDETVT